MPNILQGTFEYKYLELMLEVGKHVDDFVDAYIGPPTIRDEVNQRQAMPMPELQTALAELKAEIPSTDSQRANYLTKMITASQTALRLNRDDTLTFTDEVRLLFDIEPVKIDEARFQDALARLDAALPNTSGNLTERGAEYRKHYHLSLEQLEVAMQMCLQEIRRRTLEMIDLVPNESVTLGLVEDKPWSGYNWFLGNGQSRVELNTDLPNSALGMLSMLAHEAYPGHHTEGVLKEKYLYQDKGYTEQAMLLLYSPSAVIAEGIATTALEIIFPDDSDQLWLDEHLLPTLGIDPHPIEVRLAIKKASRDLRYVSRNASLLLHSQQLTEAETLAYIKDMGGIDDKFAQASLRFIQNSRAYVFTYTMGYDLIEAAASGDKTTIFKRLLTEPLLPSDLLEMI